MKKLLLLLSFLLVGNKISSMELTKKGLSAVSNVALCYGALVATDVIHELGHYSAVKLLFGLSKPCYLYIALNPLHTSYIKCEYPTLGIKSCLVALAGPTADLMACYALLKINNIVNEYQKNKSFKQAIIDGHKKPLVNPELNLGIAIASLYGIYNGLMNNFLPFKIYIANHAIKNDGYKALEALGLLQDK